MFTRFPFFYWGNLDNTEIRRGPSLSERRNKHNCWNRILFSFVWLFRGVTTVIRIKNGGKNSENSTSLMDKFFVPWTNFLFLGQFFCSLDNFFVLWTIFLFFGQFFCSFGQFFCSFDNFFVLEQKNCPYKTTTKNKDFCLFDEGRKSQNKWEKIY